DWQTRTRSDPIRPDHSLVTPAEAGVQEQPTERCPWIPAFAGMTIQFAGMALLEIGRRQGPRRHRDDQRGHVVFGRLPPPFEERPCRAGEIDDAIDERWRLYVPVPQRGIRGEGFPADIVL